MKNYAQSSSSAQRSGFNRQPPSPDSKGLSKYSEYLDSPYFGFLTFAR